MDADYLARAQTEIESAHQSLTDLGATNHFGEIERHWAVFLVHFERIFHRLEAAAGGKGDDWYGQLEQFRKKDPLLSYLLHARNVDEHGLKTVTKREPGLFGRWALSYWTHPGPSPECAPYSKFGTRTLHLSTSSTVAQSTLCRRDFEETRFRWRIPSTLA
jgi:hypothetical protein